MTTRRRFLQLSSLAAGIAAIGPGEAATPSTMPARGPAHWIDTLTADRPDAFDVATLQAGGLGAAVVDLDIYPRNFMSAVAALADWAYAFRQPDARIQRILGADDLDAARRTGRLGIILACQDGQILDASTDSVAPTNLVNLGLFHDLGLRVLQLTHNEDNALGSSFRDDDDGGLTRLGRKVVAEMGRLGMLVDVSHCSERTSREAIQLSTRPVAVTHGGCRALHPSRRNKSDALIRVLADHGGYFGVYNMSRWLTERDNASVDDVVDHVDRLVKLGGIDLPGFGSDHALMGDPTPQADKVRGMQGYNARNMGQPGAEALHGHVTVTALDGPDRMQVLADALRRRGYRGDAVDKLLGGNFVRVFRAACG